MVISFQGLHTPLTQGLQLQVQPPQFLILTPQHIFLSKTLLENAVDSPET